MFGEEKNLKDSSNSTNISLKDSYISLSYTKINKLITALYIVTDIIDKDEPIRLKLRTLGTEIISDINFSSREVMGEKIQTIMSFLDISSAINLISSMNASILKKEFIELAKSIKDSKQPNTSWLRDFLPSSSGASYKEEVAPYRELEKNKNFSITPAFAHKGHSIGHKGNSNFIRRNFGVQQAGTLMKVLSDIGVDNQINNESKHKRREDIIKTLKDSKESLTITDIRSRGLGSLANCGEKTLQRELAAMVKDGVLLKSGEKRWSRYKLSNAF